MGRLPVVNFAAGGVATPADGALMMKLGMDGVFVGSGIFKSPDPKKMAAAVVEAVENFEDYKIIGEVSSGLSGMAGTDIDSIPKESRLQERGW
jgi:pyridoxal 5'-phosphate synthase pdxS subunit